MSQVVLADEINRATPKTQSAPARVHGGAPGHDRRRHARDAGPVPRHRHPEPDRVRGHVRAARGAAGPLHAPHPPGLPGPAGRDRDPRRAEADAPARRRSTEVCSGRRAARAAGGRARDLRGPGRERLHRPPRRLHPDPPRRLPGRQPARVDRPLPGLAGPRRPPGPGLRDPGRRQDARRARARAPRDHQDQLVHPRHQRRARRARAAGVHPDRGRPRWSAAPARSAPSPAAG